MIHTVLEDLDIELMKQGVRLFEGRHHFGSYCTKPGPKTCLERNIRVCRIEENTEFQAIEMVQSLNPDVVLMDVNMPGMNGIQTTRKILKNIRMSGLSACPSMRRRKFPKPYLLPEPRPIFPKTDYLRN
ncbi:response regulator [uncultured Desulfobacter sp.]|uniref:response regulator n=1 Tax=uncultured Desulfobacter sp. TaxID=240139 RepID=UPI002AA7ECDB|nr:response regulator [uncultured Desulfobacter sp.]